jgi:hypothetical protein
MQLFGSSQPTSKLPEQVASSSHVSPMNSRLWSGRV